MTELLDCHAVSSDKHQGSHYCSDHVAQKAVGLDDEDIVAQSVGCPPCLHDTAVVGLDISVQTAERSEIDIVKKLVCRLVHKVDVEIPEDAVGIGIERILVRGDIVAIGARNGREASVCFGTYGHHLDDGDVLGQDAVEPTGEVVRIDRLLFFVDFEVRYH